MELFKSKSKKKKKNSIDVHVKFSIDATVDIFDRLHNHLDSQWESGGGYEEYCEKNKIKEIDDYDELKNNWIQEKINSLDEEELKDFFQNEYDKPSDMLSDLIYEEKQIDENEIEVTFELVNSLNNVVKKLKK